MKLSKFFLSVFFVLIFSVNVFCGNDSIEVIKVFNAPKGSQPSGLTWHGGYLWLSSYLKKPGVYKINTSDGSVVNFFKPRIAMNGRYGGLASDQFSIFHIQANNGRNAIEMKPPNAAVRKVFSFRANAINFSDIASHKNYLWAIGSNDALNKDDYKLYKMNYSGRVLNQYPVRHKNGLVQNHGITSDGTFLWVSAGTRLIRIDPDSGIELASFPLQADRIESLAWDGEFIWAASFHGDIYKITI